MQRGNNRMTPSRSFLWRPVLGLGVSVAMLLPAGCKDLFVTRQKVLVDAISAPGIAKPSGQSFRLLAQRTVVAGQQVQSGVVAACVVTALTTIGMYEAPGGVPPDLFIEVSYGMDTGGRVDPSTRESFLKLSARPNRRHASESTKDEEIWDVRVAVAGVAGRLETAMPLLCSVAAAYAATDTHTETTIQVPENSPAVIAVREGAIKLLDEKTAGNARTEAGATTAK